MSTDTAIRRAYVKVGERLVHYRYAGNGPPVLLIHQSPRSSEENEPILKAWASHFLMIAPDTPGFGESERLLPHEFSGERPEVGDYCDALVRFMDALGLQRAGLYGMHSGAIIGAGLAKRAPGRLTALACNGYGFWDKEEQKDFGENYLTPFHPSGFGEHLPWLFARLREQSFFFPWYKADNEHRMRLPEAPASHFHESVLDLLASGDAYRLGYGAVFRAERAVPPESEAIPTLISACDTDPLQAHIDRLGHNLPSVWQTRKLAEMPQVIEACRDFLAARPAAPFDHQPHGDAPRRFVTVNRPGFAGQLHLQQRGAGRVSHVALHAPGGSGAALLDRILDSAAFPAVVAIDLPGHGQSARLASGPPVTLESLADIVAAGLEADGLAGVTLVADGLTAPLALSVASRSDAVNAVQIIDGACPSAQTRDEWRSNYLPDLTPDLDGAYLLRAWRFARDSLFFWPWFRSGPAFAVPFDPACLAPERLAIVHRAAILARDARPVLDLLLNADPQALLTACSKPVNWEVPDWAPARAHAMVPTKA